MKIASLIEALEARRQSRVLVFAASNLDLNLLQGLYDTLRETGASPRLDIVFYCRGGVVNAARRIAMLLHEFTEHLTLIVPDRCESSGTILALAAHQVIAGPVAIFSPVDPLLQAGAGGGEEAPSAIAAQDVRLFSEMTREWFGAETEQAQGDALAILCANIFPTTLTSFYRACLETREVCLELRQLAGNAAMEDGDVRLVDQLIYGRHSHAFALSRNDIATMGLPVHPDATVEALAWEISRQLQSIMGAGSRASPEDSWIDTLFATREGVRLRERNSHARPEWRLAPLE